MRSELAGIFWTVKAWLALSQISEAVSLNIYNGMQSSWQETVVWVGINLSLTMLACQAAWLVSGRGHCLPWKHSLSYLVVANWYCYKKSKPKLHQPTPAFIVQKKKGWQWKLTGEGRRTDLLELRVFIFSNIFLIFNNKAKLLSQNYSFPFFYRTFLSDLGLSYINHRESTLDAFPRKFPYHPRVARKGCRKQILPQEENLVQLNNTIYALDLYFFSFCTGSTGEDVTNAYWHSN